MPVHACVGRARAEKTGCLTQREVNNEQWWRRLARRLDAVQSRSRAAPMRGHYANIAERAVGLTATVRVRGPDPRGDVAADAAFFAHHRLDDDHLPAADGAPVVAISATALRIPTRASTRWDERPAAGDDRERFIAPLAPFLPFLAPRHESRDDRPRSPPPPLASPLAPGVEVHVRLGREGLGGDEPGGWTRARVLASCVPRDASNAVDALAGPAGLGALRRGWTAGGVAPLDASSQVPLGAAVAGIVLIETNAARTTTTTTPPTPPPPPPEWREAAREDGFARAGARFIACGSPFAALSPTHFACGVFGGHVARAWGRSGGRVTREGGDAPADAPLLLADVVALPGMEGAPVLDVVGGGVIGVLTPPLVRLQRERDGTTWARETAPLVLTMASIRDALRELASGSSSPVAESPVAESPVAESPGPTSSSFRNPSNPLDAVVRGSVVALETDGGASWASGVVIGVHGVGGEEEGGGGIGGGEGVEGGGGRPRRALVLTNAHVVHPSSTAAGGDGEGPTVRSIRVGLPGTNAWRDAAPVYVSRGPLDVAIVELKLHSPIDARRLVPVRRRVPGTGGSLAGASPGSPVAVVGFGRVGPGAIDAGFVDCAPAVHLGAVSTVVNFSHPSPAYSRSRDRIPSSVPAMYQTTASVHSGASGGAVVCPDDGTLLGLVTSNARLGAGGRVIPNLNFSIPVELLDPVLATAAAKGTRDWVRAFEGCLEGLNESDELRSIWSLRDPATTGGEGPISKL